MSSGTSNLEAPLEFGAEADGGELCALCFDAGLTELCFEQYRLEETESGWRLGGGWYGELR